MGCAEHCWGDWRSVGQCLYFAMSATGIAALLIVSDLVFSIIKCVGVAYLVYLGLNAISSSSGGIVVKAGAKSSRKSLFTKGVVIEFANPKALLYFAAILPQFVNTAAPILPQILLMGLTTILLDFVSYSLYAFLGFRLTRNAVKDWVIKSINRVAGAALIFAGFRMASVTASR
ncbi:MAG: LysE family translocator [Parasphingorhabdus sp.]